MSSVEAEELTKEQMADCDTNKDGKISKAEWLAYNERMCQHQI